jgi:hypothetical protein
MEVDLREVIASLSGQVADLAVRCAVAEARVKAYERAEIDALAAEESGGDD